MKTREYCCCAIPLVNAGIYITLIEHIVASLLVGILSIATPSIVGASTPSYAPWILAIICFVITAVQLLGLIGVAREKFILYRRYVTLNGLLIMAAFSIAAAWIILSATRHSNAQAKCIQDFFTPATSASSSSEGGTLCNIFPWVDVGIMGALWALLAILQLYLFIVLSSYVTAQRRDYDRIYDPSQPLTADNIPLDNRTDPWDSRPSVEYRDQYGARDAYYKHVRNQSSVSASDIMNAPSQKPNDGFSNPNYDYSYNPTVTRP
ncbi:hypothetical protein BYT27DRAFT_7099910 [Phlegmacium glaucopus]|nr:hypothetical protein BYT27DRAFT_7099910 [Phlegmacium glaucopus]